jgi:DNA-binding transcriptional ArsR family regulator
MQAHALTRATDPATSHEAAAKLPVTALCLRVLEALKAGPQTTHEIAARTGLAVVTVSPRIKPLRLAGLVEESGERRDGRNVWRIAA